jgi:tetratricopeptide (TPR) repeat protein
VKRQKPVTKRKGTSASRGKLVALPSRTVMEGFLANMFGGSGDGGGQSDVDRAQQLMYDAWDAPSAKRRVDLAREALAISPDCADAYVLLAQEAASSLADAIDLNRKGVEAGERALGKRAFEEDVGHFWGLLETRPYMRARQGLAQCLWQAGQRDDAIAHYHDMLRLNPNDNQGVRYALATWLLDLGRDDDLAALLKQYEDDGAAAWAYTMALAEFRKGGDSEDARQLLTEAKQTNRHVPAYLLGKKKLSNSCLTTSAWATRTKPSLMPQKRWSDGRRPRERSTGSAAWHSGRRRRDAAAERRGRTFAYKRRLERLRAGTELDEDSRRESFRGDKETEA